MIGGILAWHKGNAQTVHEMKTEQGIAWLIRCGNREIVLLRIDSETGIERGTFRQLMRARNGGRVGRITRKSVSIC